jgi:lipopolysaccharide O-acetyltransferase
VRNLLGSLSKYSLYQKIYILACGFLTRVCYPQARLIRFPLDLRNKKNIRLGKGFTCGHGCRIEACNYGLGKEEVSLRIGEHVEINDFVHISAYGEVVIGDNVLMASKIYISDLNHGDYSAGAPFDITVPFRSQKISARPIRIEENVWIGESVCILGGVTIGRNSIIGAMSLVTKSIPPYTIAAGNPARPIKRFDHATSTWERVSE